MIRFLRFTVEELLAGRACRLKEYVIGVEVFDRGDSFDPRVDPIVRVEARRLRSKLCDYYEREGRLETLRIEFPKGGYVPRIAPLEVVIVPSALSLPFRRPRGPFRALHRQHVHRARHRESDEPRVVVQQA
jgi:serine/threonine-protein kinase